MPEQNEYPSVWTCESPKKRVVVEIRVPDRQGAAESDATTVFDQELIDAVDPEAYSWIEIPTTNVEQYVEKGQSASIQRTAKVEFPTEWGENTSDVRHNSPRRLVDSFEPTAAQPFMLGRVWLQDADGSWVLQHLGWIGGVGSAADDGVSKLWIYDFAELLSGVPIGETYKNPTLNEAIESIARLTNDNTPIPLAEAVLFAPETEEEFTTLAENFRQPEDDRPFSLSSDTIEGEDNLLSPNGDNSAATYYSLDRNAIVSESTALDDTEVFQRIDPERTVAVPKNAGSNFGAVRIGTGRIPIAGLDSKSFTANHDVLQDVYDWFESKTGAKLHFEPRANSVVLVADIEPSRRTFAQRAVIERERDSGEPYEFHRPTTVIENDALYEIKPINTVYLRGSTSQGIFDTVQDFGEEAISALPFTGPPPAETYPVVEVRSEPLYDAAGNTALAPAVVESDATTLDNAEREARRRLRQLLEEQSEGSVLLGGTPRITPYDRLDSFEVCQDEILYEQEPVSYEIESVKHEKSADDVFKTEVTVSIWTPDDSIRTVRATMEEVSGNRQV